MAASDLSYDSMFASRDSQKGGNKYKFYDLDDSTDDSSDDDNEDNYRGGNNLDDSDSDSDSSDFFGGAADGEKVKHFFSVVDTSVGSYEGGHFVSNTAMNAAKKAATAVFRHVDVESGVSMARKQPANKTAKEIPINSALVRRYGKTPLSEVNIVILRRDRKALSKYYSYDAYRVKLDQPIEVSRTGAAYNIKFAYKITVKAAELNPKYKALNEELKKEHNAAKRAAKRAETKKDEKKPRAKKEEKGEKKPRAKKEKITIDDILANIEKSSKKAKAAKEPKAKAAKEPKAKAAKEPKVKAAKEPKVKAAKEPKAKAAKEPKAKAAKEPKVKAAKEPKVKAAKEPKVKAAKEPKVKAAKEPKVAKKPAVKKGKGNDDKKKKGGGFCSFF
jgi:hypothetical protein